MKANNILCVKRSDWNETAKRLECAGWHYIGTPTATGKTIYRRDNSEIEIIIEEETPTDNTPTTMNANEINARRAANEFVNAPTHRINTVDKHGNEMSCPAWGLDMAEAIAADRRAEFPNDTTEIVATGATEYVNETKAPEFSELSHAATNIVLTAENDGDIYRRHVQPLILSLVNKIKRGISPDRKRLAQSAAIRTIIAAALAEMYCAGWMEDNTKVKAIERKEAAEYLAWSYISDAEDEYNNQMAAYK